MSPLSKSILFCLWTIPNIVSSEEDYSDCLWFGYTDPTPIYPIGICSTVQNESEDEEDGLSTYSYMYQCTEEWDAVKFVVWVNEDCVDIPIYNYTYTESDGYYFHCSSHAYECPYTKLKLYQLYNDTSDDDGDHDDHLCTIDVNIFQELSFVTNICIDYGYGQYYKVDCSAQTVTLTQYQDDACVLELNSTVIHEGCDDPFNWNTYVQVAECEDAEDYPTSQPTSPSSKTDNDLAIVFSVIIGVIVIILVLTIGIGITKRNKLKVTTNKDLKQPINEVAYNEIQSVDADEMDNNNRSPHPDNQQDITGGQDVNEIPIVQDDSIINELDANDMRL